MNHTFLCKVLFCAMLSSFTCGIAKVNAQFEGMKYRIPAGANTIVLINAEKLFGSPVADRDRWQARRQAAYEAGISALPPQGTEVLIAASMDHEFGKTLWEVAMMKFRGDRKLTDVATRYGGSMDNVAGRNAVRLPNDQYVVQISPALMGTYMPANRQDVARWLQGTDTVEASQQISGYLSQALTYATKVGTPIVMAMDLADTVSETEVKQKAPKLSSLQGQKIPLDQLAKLVTGVQGITLGITVGEQVFGALRVDFQSSPAILQSVAKPLVIEILSRHGAMIDDMANWTPAINGNTLMLSGPLSTEGTKRALSVLELPPALAHSMDKIDLSGGDSDSAARLASQQYFKSVSSLIDGLRDKPDMKTMGQVAMWYDKYARKIDNLPVLNVDEALLNYGADVSSLLRNGEMALKGVGMRSVVRTGENNPSVGTYEYAYGGAGGYRGYRSGFAGGYAYGYQVNPRASVREKGRTDAIIRQQERVKGASSVQQIWQVLDESTAAIRREMTQKYGVEF